LRKDIFILILAVSIGVNFSFSQEIEDTYKYRKEIGKVKYYKYKEGMKTSKIELDSLVLYKDGTFYRKNFYTHRGIKWLEQKGNWKIDNGKLSLNINGTKTEPRQEEWTFINEEYKYKVKRKKLIPYSGFEFKSDRKLKRN
jgi:hypothetical protein